MHTSQLPEGLFFLNKCAIILKMKGGWGIGSNTSWSRDRILGL